MEKIIDMTTILDDNNMNINTYYGARGRLRSKYTDETLKTLKDSIDNEVRKSYDYKHIKAITIEPENYTLKFVYNKKSDIEKSIPEIEHIISECIMDQFGESIPYVDSFTLADELRIVI